MSVRRLSLRKATLERRLGRERDGVEGKEGWTQESAQRKLEVFDAHRGRSQV